MRRPVAHVVAIAVGLLTIQCLPVEAQMTYRIFADFGTTPGYGVLDALTQGPDGALYGTTEFGGIAGVGTVFRITKSGLYTQLYQFTGGNDGGQPVAGLVFAPDGNFYGLTSRGGDADAGTIFRITPQGALTRIYSFQYTGDGAYPQSHLTVGSDGALYGATPSGGGSYGAGSLFKVTTDGEFTVLHLFGGVYYDGGAPLSVLQATDGSLYGTALTKPGLTNNFGMVFRYAADGVTILHVFNGSDGATPNAGLAEGPDGRLYGTTRGANGTGDPHGSVYAIDPATGTLQTVHTFTGPDGDSPLSGLLRASDGTLFGTARGGTYDGVVYAITPDGSFHLVADVGQLDPRCNCYAAGYLPIGGLTQGDDGRLYGTTISGGASQSGTIFAVSTDGYFDKLYDFATRLDTPEDITRAEDGTLVGPWYGQLANGGLYRVDGSGNISNLHVFTGNDGADPGVPVVQGGDGALYGVTPDGGPPDLITGARYGVLFKIADGALSILHAFDEASGSPSTIAVGPDGALYGTASGGTPAFGYGAIYRVDTAGAFSILHSFTQNEGAPAAMVAAGGMFYGVSLSAVGSTYGVVFSMDLQGHVTVLSALPESLGLDVYLVPGTDGAIYGSSYNGGTLQKGTVFRIDATGTLTTLHQFSGADGQYPRGVLSEGPDGRLYGTTTAGGTQGFGLVFRVARDGSGFEVLHEFSGGEEVAPKGQLVQDPAHNFFGIAGRVVFELSYPPLQAVVTSPAAGQTVNAGTAALIQWTAIGGVGDQQSFDALLSVDGGTTFTPIAGCTNLAGTSRSCSWNVSAQPTSQAIVELRAHDFGGNTVEARSAAFSIAGPSTFPQVALTSSSIDFGSLPVFQSTTPRTFQAGTFPQDLAVGDFNRDGKLDMAVVNVGSTSLPAPGSVTILLGDGAGGFVGAADYPVVPGAPSGIALADFNHDGALDVAVGNQSDKAFSLLPGNGDGTFGAVTRHTVDQPAFSVAAGDLNGDGNIDVVTSSGSVSLGAGDGTFVNAPALPVGGKYFAIGDLDGDGIADLATGAYWIHGNGDGTFGAATFLGVVGFGVDLADLNGDGIPDIAVSNHGLNGDNIWVLFGTGGGQFGSPVSIPVGSHPWGIRAADLDGDGFPELIVGNSWDITVAVVPNHNGTFGAAEFYLAGPEPQGIAVGDFDGDGRPDVAAAALFDGITVLMNRSDGSLRSSRAITLHNTGTAPLHVTSISINGAEAGAFFRAGGTCSSAVSVGNRCTIVVGFLPKSTGPKSATLEIVDDSPTSPHELPLTGIGLRATPQITWPTPAAILYGTALGPAQLNATASVPGTFTYTPAAGTVLRAGSGQILSVTFTPTDSNTYESATATVAVDVLRARPTIVWPTPAAIGFGTPLDGTQLNATADVPGTFLYSPAAGTLLHAGTQTLSVVFTPADTADYDAVSTTVSVAVNPAVTAVQWIPPTHLEYGSTLGVVDINAALHSNDSFVRSACVYAPAAGTQLSAGTYSISVTCTPTSGDYAASSADRIVVIEPALPPAEVHAVKEAVWAGGSAPHFIALNPALRRAYVGSGNNDVLSVLDMDSGAMLATQMLPPSGGDATRGAVVDPISSRVYLPRVASDAIAVLDGTTNTLLAPISLSEPLGVALDSQGRRLFVSGVAGGTPYLATLNLDSQAIVASISAPGAGPIAFNRANGLAYVMSRSANVVHVIDPSSGLVATIPVERNPFSVAVNAVTNRVFVTNRAALTISVIDGVTHQVIATIPTPGFPVDVAVDESANRLYVPMDILGLAIIDGSKNARIDTLQLGTCPFAAAVDPARSQVYVTDDCQKTLSAVHDTASTLAWPAPVPLTYGSPLGPMQLGATASVPGTFTYVPPAGTVFDAGRYMLTTTFTPADSNDYLAATAIAPLTVNRADASIELAVTPDAPSVFGQSITLTAEVTAPAGGSPTGDVTFTADGVTIGSAALNGTSASVAVSSLDVGSHTIGVTYSGDANFNGGAAAPISYAVAKAGSLITLGADPNPSGLGSPIALTAVVTAAAPGSGTPTGTVEFFDGAALLGTAPLTFDGTSAIATLSTAFPVAGSHTLVASYQGDVHFDGAASSALDQLVNDAASSSTTTLAVSDGTVAAGAAVTLEATVDALAGKAAPTGQVEFMDGQTSLGVAPLTRAGGRMVASLSTSSLAIGTHTLTARYGGDSALSPSVSGPVVLTIYGAVAPRTTTTTVAASPNPSAAGETVVISAVVKGKNAIDPTGAVQFFADGVILGSAPLVLVKHDMTAVFTVNVLAVGEHTLVATYPGDANLAGSASSSLLQCVGCALPKHIK